MTGQAIIDLIQKYSLETFEIGVVLEDVKDNVIYETPLNGRFIKISDEDSEAWLSAKHEKEE